MNSWSSRARFAAMSGLAGRSTTRSLSQMTSWQEYIRPHYERNRGMTRLVDRVEFFWLEDLRKIKRIPKSLIGKLIGAGKAIYWTWRSRGWVPLWAIKKMQRARKFRSQLKEISHENIHYWQHKQLTSSGRKYRLYPTEAEIKKARKAAFMFAIRAGYRIITQLIRGKRRMYLEITRV